MHLLIYVNASARKDLNPSDFPHLCELSETLPYDVANELMQQQMNHPRDYVTEFVIDNNRSLVMRMHSGVESDSKCCTGHS